MTATVGANIIDSTNGNGLLKVAKNNLAMVNNSQIMVWKAEDAGYRFATVTFTRGFQDKEANKAEGNANFTFWMNEKGIVMQELADGAADEDGLSMQMKITYINSRGISNTLYFDISQRMAQGYAQDELKEGGWIESLIRGVGNFTNVKFSALIRKGNVVIESETVDY